MFVFLAGLFASAYALLAQRAADPLGFFREPNPDEPTLWRRVLRGLGWVGVGFALLLTLYLLLSALTADNIVGRQGIAARVLDSVDGVVLGVLKLVQQLIPDVEFSL